MKFFLFFILIYSITFGASIDTKLFDSNDNQQYLKEIEKTINDEYKNKEKPKAIYEEEKRYLTFLKEISSKDVQIKEYPYKNFEKKQIEVETIIDAIKFYGTLDEAETQTKSLSKNIQNQLAFLRKNIENILEEDKEKLLGYQLQFAYYKKEKQNIDKKLDLYKQEKNKLLLNISNNISKLKDPNLEVLDNKLYKYIENNDKLSQYIDSLNIDLQREKLNENKENINKLQNSINRVQEDLKQQIDEIIFTLTKKAIYLLKDKKVKEFLSIYKKIEENISKVEKENYNYLLDALKSLSKKQLNDAKLLLANSSSQIGSIFDSIKSFFNTSLIVFNEQAITPLSLLKALFLIVIGIFLGSLYKKWLKKISTKWPNISEMSLKVTANVGFYLIIFITFVIALGSLGIDMSSISLIAGALSIGIGFGLQTVVSNFIAGIILMFERTIKIGDVIEISDMLKGTVTDIRVRSTTLKTFDNIDIIVPNSSFIQNNVINWTLEDKSRRLHVPFGVAYGTKVEKVKEIVLEELLNSDLKFIRDDKDKQPEIRFESMNSSSVDLELLVYIRVNDRLTPNSLKSDFLLLIYNALYKHNIEIPFPQLDLHIKKAVKSS